MVNTHHIHIGPRLDSIGARLDQIGGRLGQIGGRLGQIGGRLGQIGARLGQIGARMEGVCKWINMIWAANELWTEISLDKSGRAESSGTLKTFIGVV